MIGVGQLSEIEDKIKEETGDNLSLFQASAADFVGDASDALARLGKFADADLSEVSKAKKAWAEVDLAVAPTTALCDILTASRIEGTVLPFDFSRWEEEKKTIWGSESHISALKILEGMKTFHFPVSFLKSIS